MKESLFSSPFWAIAITITLANVANSHLDLYQRIPNFVGATSQKAPPSIDVKQPSGETQRTGAAPRSSCGENGQEVPCEELVLLALIPVNQGTLDAFEEAREQNPDIEDFREWEQRPEVNISSFARTLEPHPIFWFYVSQLPDNCEARFEIQELQEQEQKLIPGRLLKETGYFRRDLSGLSGGIVGFQLPDTEEYALQLNQRYRWNFSINCNDNIYSQVKGSVVRVSLTPDIQEKIETAKKEKDQEFLFEIGWKEHDIWHETITTLADIHRLGNNQQGVSDKLTELLKDKRVDFGELENAPVLGWHRFE